MRKEESMSIHKYFGNRNQANSIIQRKVREAVRDVFDEWGMDGDAAVTQFQPMLDNITWDVIAEEWERKDA
jgi:histidinol dehydrogenase